MPKFVVSITRTVTDLYVINADNAENAEEIATYNKVDPVHTKHGEEIISVEEIANEAVKLGRIQVEFLSLYGTKEMKDRLSKRERTDELLRICTRENVGFRSFEYLERHLLKD